MDVDGLLVEAFGRVTEHVHEVIDGLDPDALTTQPEPGTNPIGWLVWHLTRVEDGHVAELLDAEQEWVENEWGARFGLRSSDPHDVGYGHTAEQVAAVRPDGVDALTGYHDAVAARTRAFLESVTPADLDRVVDEGWDPPVTMGVRLVSVVDDAIQHAGQAAYVRGLLAHRAAGST